MIVLDCNAAIAMVLRSEEGRALSSLILRGETIIAPKDFCSEMTHAFASYVKGGFFDAEAAAEYGSEAIGIVDEFVDDTELWREVLPEAIRLGHSSYDVFYFVLARRYGATLFTLDKKLASLCERNGVNCIASVTI